MASRPLGEQSLNAEVLAETSASLGRAGRTVEQTLSELNAWQGDSEERKRLLKAASDAVYWYFVQRELNGMCNQEEAIALYDIPDEVLKRLGIMGAS